MSADWILSELNAQDSLFISHQASLTGHNEQELQWRSKAFALATLENNTAILLDENKKFFEKHFNYSVWTNDYMT